MKTKKTDHGRPFDWGKISHEYGQYRDIYPRSFYEQIKAFGIAHPGQKILDIGTGTGVIPRVLSETGACFTALDIVENQIAVGQQLAEAAGIKINWQVGNAQEVEFPANSFDVITAIQCWNYFDPVQMQPRLHHFLKKEGRFLIAHMIWLPEECEIAAATEALILKYNPDWTGGGVKRIPLKEPSWLGDKFELEQLHTYDEHLPFNYETWRGRIRASRGIGATLDPATIERFDREHFALLSESQPESFTVLHQLIFTLVRKI